MHRVQRSAPELKKRRPTFGAARPLIGGRDDHPPVASQLQRCGLHLRQAADIRHLIDPLAPPYPLTRGRQTAEAHKADKQHSGATATPRREYPGQDQTGHESQKPRSRQQDIPVPCGADAGGKSQSGYEQHLRTADHGSGVVTQTQGAIRA